MKDKQSISYVAVLLMLGPLLLFAAEFMAAWDFNVLQTLPPKIYSLLSKGMQKLVMAKMLYFFLFFCTLYLVDVYKAKPSSKLVFLSAIGIVASGYFFLYFPSIVIQTSQLQLVAVIYLLAFILLHFFIVILYRQFAPSGTKSEETIFGLNKKGIDQYSISLKTLQGDIVIPNLFRGSYVGGGAGAGKSDSIIEPTILQCIMKGFTGVVYDFKGNPPTLTKTVFRAIEYLKKNTPSDYPGKIPSFHQINFSQPWLSTKINVLSPRYVTSTLIAKTMATTLAKALVKSWKDKPDFWAQNAIAILHATIWNLAKNYPEFSTLPHVICLITSDTERFMTWLEEDEDVKRLMRPISDARELEAGGQVAGALSSIQLPMNDLFNEEVFWAFSEDQIDVTLNSFENPAWFCICNDPIKKNGLNGGISLLLTFFSSWLNQQGRRPCLFAIDELPTAYIADLEVLPNTGRSNKIAVMVGAQSTAQLDMEYGKDPATTIRGSLGNYFVGNVALQKEAEELVRSVGQANKMKTEHSYSESGVSRSERLEKQDHIKVNQIMDLKPGEFAGHLAGAEQGWFHVRFKQLKDYASLGEAKFPEKYQDHDLLQSLIQANFEQIKAEADEMLKEAYSRKVNSQ